MTDSVSVCLTWLSSCRALSLTSRSSAWAWASLSLTVISLSCSSFMAFFFGDSFQWPPPPPVLLPRDMWCCRNTERAGGAREHALTGSLQRSGSSLYELPASAGWAQWRCPASLGMSAASPAPSASSALPPPAEPPCCSHQEGNCSSGWTKRSRLHFEKTNQLVYGKASGSVRLYVKLNANTLMVSKYNRVRVAKHYHVRSS